MRLFNIKPGHGPTTTVKKILASLVLVFSSLSICNAQTSTTVLDKASGTECVWCNSSAPPPTPSDDIFKPEWKRDPVPGDTALMHVMPMVPKEYNVWYPLRDRIGSLRIGGSRDSFVGFMRFVVPPTKVPFKKVTLRLFLEAEGSTPLAKELEIRAVTSTDPLTVPVKKVNDKATWTPERIRFSMQPSSRFLTHVPVKAGWVEIDLTEWAKGDTCHGLRFSDTDGPTARFVRIHGPASANPPQLVVEK